MINANIISTQISRNGYHLSRYKDMGSYVIGNCKFVPYIENISENNIKNGKILKGTLIAKIRGQKGGHGLQHKGIKFEECIICREKRYE